MPIENQKHLDFVANNRKYIPSLVELDEDDVVAEFMRRIVFDPIQFAQDYNLDFVAVNRMYLSIVGLNHLVLGDDTDAPKET